MEAIRGNLGIAAKKIGKKKEDRGGGREFIAAVFSALPSIFPVSSLPLSKFRCKFASRLSTLKSSEMLWVVALLSLSLQVGAFMGR